jgi:hypothetical protein
LSSVTPAKPALAYLFVAVYTDGQCYEQGEADESLFGGVNAYTDIFYKPWRPLDQLVTFALVSQKDPKLTWSVNLVDGHFEFCGVPFEVSPAEEPLPKGGRYELVYQKRREISRTPNGVSTDRYVHYRIGWKYTVQGREYIQTIAVS